MRRAIIECDLSLWADQPENREDARARCATDATRACRRGDRVSGARSLHSSALSWPPDRCLEVQGFRLLHSPDWLKMKNSQAAAPVVLIVIEPLAFGRWEYS